MDRSADFLSYLRPPQEDLERRLAEYAGLLAKTGELGRTFATEFFATGCREMFQETAIKGIAGCLFGREIGYTNEAMASTLQFFETCTHERVHALQCHYSAATHAHSWNPHSPVMLCPRDWLWLKDAMERDAFSKSALICRLLAEAMPESADAIAGISLGSDFLKMDEWSSMDTQLSALADVVFELQMEQGKPMSLGDWQHEYILQDYPSYIEKFRERGMSYVRLDKEDLLAVGGTLGVNCLGRPPDYLFTLVENPPVLTQANRLLLSELNAQLGMEDESRLPTLREGLAAHGLTPEEMLSRSRRA
jgi:hypothetical protein